MNDERNDLQVLTRVPHEMEAALIANALENHGIAAIAAGEYTSGFRAEAPGEVRVLVKRSDFLAAREFLEEIERTRSREALPPDGSWEDGHLEEEVSASVPCPERRSTAMQNPEPKVPADIHPLTKEVLDRLRSRPEAAAIILGGGVALQHYCPFRSTRDIDAWWQNAPREATQAIITEVMNEVALRHGCTLNIRNWGETDSYELQQEGQTVFSFQIALRTTELDPPLTSSWDPVKIETFRDNLASKMNAVVSRGAPRDFLDVFQVCQRGLSTPQECWELWQKKNPDKDARSARANVLRHLEQLQARRPLDTIEKQHDRAHAETVRRWLKNEFCREIVRGPEPRR